MKSDSRLSVALAGPHWRDDNSAFVLQMCPIPALRVSDAGDTLEISCAKSRTGGLLETAIELSGLVLLPTSANARMATLPVDRSEVDLTTNLDDAKLRMIALSGIGTSS